MKVPWIGTRDYCVHSIVHERALCTVADRLSIPATPTTMVPDKSCVARILGGGGGLSKQMFSNKLQLYPNPLRTSAQYTSDPEQLFGRKVYRLHSNS